VCTSKTIAGRQVGDEDVNEFQKAAAAARRRYGADAWPGLAVSEQAKAIYAELRRIDAERVAAMLSRSRRPMRSRDTELADAVEA